MQCLQKGFLAFKSLEAARAVASTPDAAPPSNPTPASPPPPVASPQLAEAEVILGTFAVKVRNQYQRPFIFVLIPFFSILDPL